MPENAKHEQRDGDEHSLQVPLSSQARSSTPTVTRIPSNPMVVAASSTKRRIQLTSPEQYAECIISHANLPFGSSLYSGQNYEGLAEQLSEDEPQRRGSSIVSSQSATTDAEATDPNNFVYLHDLSLPEGAEGQIQPFNDMKKLERVLEEKRQKKPSLLLFICGNASREWLMGIGYHCGIVDPEFWLRHVSNPTSSNRHDSFTMPSLPSSSRSFIRLNLVNLGKRKGIGQSTQTQVEQLREAANEAVQHFLPDSRQSNTRTVGSSIIRSMAFHDASHFSIHQQASIHMKNDFGNGWIAIIWLDSGRDLFEEMSSSGSTTKLWTDPFDINFIPVIMHRQDIVLRTKYITRSHRFDKDPGVNVLSASLIARQYGRFLHQETSIAEPLYALSEVFAFSAAAEAQFLNMMDSIISTETSQLLRTDGNTQQEQDLHSSALVNMLYNKKILEKHALILMENVDVLKHRLGGKGTQTLEQKQKDRLQEALEPILDDFVYLYKKADSLSIACDRGMEIAGKNAMVAESRRTMKQTKYISKLTLLAFLYIPAAFTTSILGMNFLELADLRLWVWIAVLVPLYLVNLVILYVDIPAVIQRAILASKD